jgi:hypothetical protein
MSWINRIFIWLGIVTFGFILGWVVAKNTSFFSKNQKIASSVVVENMEKVLKLVSIEANVSELYKYQDYYTYDISFLRKKALLRVNAKVLAGFDLKKVNYKIDTIKRQVVISDLPSAELLSIDHTLDYYDIDQGLFNSFTNQDYNHINANAKEFIRKTTLQKGILKEAETRKTEMLSTLKLVLQGIGYDLVLPDGQKNLLQ